MLSSCKAGHLSQHHAHHGLCGLREVQDVGQAAGGAGQGGASPELSWHACEAVRDMESGRAGGPDGACGRDEEWIAGCAGQCRCCSGTCSVLPAAPSVHPPRPPPPPPPAARSCWASPPPSKSCSRRRAAGARWRTRAARTACKVRFGPPVDSKGFAVTHGGELVLPAARRRLATGCCLTQGGQHAAGKPSRLGHCRSCCCLRPADADGLRLPRPSGLVLERNEVIALFNTLERLAAGVEVVRALSLQLRWALRRHYGNASQVDESAPRLGVGRSGRGAAAAVR